MKLLGGVLASCLVWSTHGSLEEEVWKVDVVQNAHPGRNLRGQGKKMEYAFKAFGEEHSIELKPCKGAFFDNFKSVLVDANGKMTEHKMETDCFYESAEENRRALFSFCEGMVYGHIQSKESDSMNDFIHVQPHDTQDGVHVAYRMRDLKEEVHSHGKCGLNDNNIKKFSVGLHNDWLISPSRELEEVTSAAMKAASSARRKLAGTVDVELALVNDYSRFLLMGTRTQVSAAYITKLVSDTFKTFPGDYKVDIALVGMYTFTEENTWLAQPRDNGKKITVEQYLYDAAIWNEQVLEPNAGHAIDILHVLIGDDFYSPELDGVVGLAYRGGVCKKNQTPNPLKQEPKFANVGITQATFSSTEYIANIMSHEIGHNLNLTHTLIKQQAVPGCPRSGDQKYIMDDIAGDDPIWNSCDGTRFTAYMDASAADCLLSGTGELFSSPTCGNGVIEAGEQCDCLLGDTASDPCCECSTCTFKSGSTCAATDECCDELTCQPYTVGDDVTCRAAGTGIDALCKPNAEKCDGTSSKCPVNEVAPTGTACDSNNGKCYFGECRSLREQCQKVGYDGVSASCPNSCGNELQCIKTSEPAFCFKPSNVGVEDGTPCGSSGGVCYQGACTTDLGSLPTPADLLNCSNGVQDGTETDLDCGGSCLPCIESQACLVDGDCLFPSFCNTTTKVCEDDNGKGIRDPPTPDGVIPEDLSNFLKKVEQWVKENPYLAGGIGGGLLLLIALSCFPCCCSSNAKNNRAKVVRRVRRDPNKSNQLQPAYN